VLRDNHLTIHRSLSPHFSDLLLDLTALESNARSLRIKYKSDPDDAIEELLDLINVDNEQLWFEFLSALDSSLKSIRRMFFSDEEWKGK